MAPRISFACLLVAPNLFHMYSLSDALRFSTRFTANFEEGL